MEKEKKIDMFKQTNTGPYIDYNYIHFCSKCSRYKKCYSMDPECEHSKVKYN